MSTGNHPVMYENPFNDSSVIYQDVNQANFPFNRDYQMVYSKISFNNKLYQQLSKFAIAYATFVGKPLDLQKGFLFVLAIFTSAMYLTQY